MPAARLPHRLWRHCRRSIAVRVEEGLGDLERAPLIVMSKDFVVLQKERGSGYRVLLYIRDGKRCNDV